MPREDKGEKQAESMGKLGVGDQISFEGNERAVLEQEVNINQRERKTGERE